LKVLVTGREGQVARSLAERASAHPGIDLVFAARPALDLERPETIARCVAAHSPDLVIGCAAYTAVDWAEDEPGLAMRVNGTAAGELAAAARRAGARIIQLSTDYVFDGAKGAPYVEDDPADPVNAYGRTKLAGELAVGRENPDHVIVRTAWVYSPFGRNFVTTMLRRAATQHRLKVVADQVGSPTSALDLADGLLRMVEVWQADPAIGVGGAYHLAGRGAATWHDVARHVFEVSRAHGGPTAEVVAIAGGDWPARAARPPSSRLESAKFARDFGFACPVWQDSVAHVVQRLVSPSAGP
jgi:dTDP-4-dehydrorhamnose reductase